MSKSLYQYKFDPEQKQMLEQSLNIAIVEEKYLNKGGINTFTCGGGWLTAKRRIQYKITEGILHLCIWKVVAPIVPMWEMGCSDVKNTYGVVLNDGMKTAVDRIAYKVNQACNLTPMTICETVEDNFLDLIR